VVELSWTGTVTRCTIQRIDFTKLFDRVTVPLAEKSAFYHGLLDRANRARISWRSFYEGYQAAHPELRDLRISSDFRVAFSVKWLGEFHEANAVELSPEERQQAESRHRERVESEAALKQARENWYDFQYELVAGRFPGAEPPLTKILFSGQTVAVPLQWQSGLALTPDFRLGVPTSN
jgi:hypothetical protein